MADEKKDNSAGSVAARAWNATKAEGDPEWANMPNLEFKGKLEHAVERVQATGIAQTNFEIEAKKQLAADAVVEKEVGGPMAVVDPEPGLGGPVVAADVSESEKAPAKKETAEKAAAIKEAQKTDPSGKTPETEALKAANEGKAEVKKADKPAAKAAKAAPKRKVRK